MLTSGPCCRGEIEAIDSVWGWCECGGGRWLGAGLFDPECDVSFCYRTGRNEQSLAGIHNRSETFNFLICTILLRSKCCSFQFFTWDSLGVKGGMGPNYRSTWLHNLGSFQINLIKYEMLYFIIFINFLQKKMRITHIYFTHILKSQKNRAVITLFSLSRGHL